MSLISLSPFASGWLVKKYHGSQMVHRRATLGLFEFAIFVKDVRWTWTWTDLILLGNYESLLPPSEC